MFDWKYDRSPMGEVEKENTLDKEKSSESSSKNRVEAAANRIYFYSEVNRSNILTLNKYLKNMETNLLNRANTWGTETPEIYLHINSYGGSVFAGFSAMDYIAKSKVPVNTIIDGCAASAATMMSVAGAKRLMHENAFMLIHQLSSVSWGKYEALKDDMKNNDMLMERIKSIYLKHTKVPQKQLANMLKHDLWWDAQTCLKYGLVDEII